MPEMILLELEEKMEERLSSLSKDFSKVRTGRANPKILDDVKIDYYGALTPIGQVGNISVPEPNQIVVKPYDRTVLKEVERAINAANLGVSPNNEGEQLRLVFPMLTTERRKESTKEIKKHGEEAKVAMRNIRRDGNDALKKLEKSSDITEDELKIYQDDVQKLTDKFNTKIDELVKSKEADIMSI